MAREPTNRTLARIRPELVARADQLCDVPLTLVVAPAGSGKSTLLGIWRNRLTESGIATAWLDLTPLHSDLAIVVGDLIDSISAAVGPAFGVESRRLLANLPDIEQDWRIVLRGFRSDCGQLGRPLVVLLDNYHNLDPGSPAARLLGELARSPLSGVHLVVATRGAEPSSVTRLRAEGAVHDVTAADLALTTDQIAEVLDSLQLEPAPDLVADLQQRTDGWAIGVVLAARALRRQPVEQRQSFLMDLARHRDLFAYVAGELLEDEPAEMVRLLEAVALLGRADLPLLRATVVDSRIADLVARALDHGLLFGDGGSFAVHPLWQELLIAHLRDRLDGQAWQALLRRFGNALADSGRTEEALPMLAEAEDWTQIAILLARDGARLVAHGQHGTVLAWLSRLSPEVLVADPRLRLLEGLALSRAMPDRAITAFDQAAAEFRAGGDGAGERQALVQLMMLSYSQNRLDVLQRSVRRMLTFSRLITSASARGTALVAAAGWCFTQGRLVTANRFAERAAGYPLESVGQWATAAVRIVTAMFQGDSARARQIAEAALAEQAILDWAPAYYSILSLHGAQLGMLGQETSGWEEIARSIQAFRDYRLTRHLAISLQSGANILARRGDRERALELGDEAIRLNAAIGELPNEAMVRAEQAARLYRWGEPVAAMPHAERVVEIFRHGDLVKRSPHTWYYLIALWILARTGQIDDVWPRVRRRLNDFGQPGLPMARWNSLMILADLASQASEHETARRLARDAWQVADLSGLTLIDGNLGEHLISATAPIALRSGASVEYVLHCLGRISADRSQEVLTQAVEDAPSPIRVKILEQLATIGSPTAYPILRQASRDPAADVRKAARAALDQLDLRPGYQLRVQLLGGFRLWRGDEEVSAGEWRGSAERRLFFRLLAGFGRPLAREQIIDDLWPDAEIGAGGNSLRVALTRLLDVLEPGRPSGAPSYFLTSRPESIEVSQSAGVQVDYLDWLADVSRLEGADDLAIEPVLRLFETYRDGLLPEQSDPWLDPLRDRLLDRLRLVSHRAAAAALMAGKPEETIVIAGQILDRDPSDEPGWIYLVRGHLGRGDRSAALRAFQRAETNLRSLLDLGPSEELLALARQARGD